jgi:hypothetical protein
MAKDWGVARFNAMGSMEYLLESGQWLSDGRLFDGAPIRLFDSMAEAVAHAKQFPKQSQAHGVQFLIDGQGRVLTAHCSLLTAHCSLLTAHCSQSRKPPTGRHA